MEQITITPQAYRTAAALIASFPPVLAVRHEPSADPYSQPAFPCSWTRLVSLVPVVTAIDDCPDPEMAMAELLGVGLFAEYPDGPVLIARRARVTVVFPDDHEEDLPWLANRVGVCRIEAWLHDRSAQVHADVETYLQGKAA